MKTIEANSSGSEHCECWETTGMPKVNLENLYNTLVNTPNQREYDRLMKIFETGGWTRMNGYIPTAYFKVVGPTTYVWGYDLFEETDTPDDYKEAIKMTVNDFCATQKIDELKQKEIHKWFRNNKTNRSSLGQRLI